MKLWRIATETRDYPAHDLSGGGAAKGAGRWNDAGEHVVYCAPTIAIAVLETAAHVDDGGLPLNRYLVEIDVPDAIWIVRQIAHASTLPAAWDAIPAGRASVSVGSEWFRSKRCAILAVPSVIVPEETAALVNAQHPDAKQMTARTLRRFEYNRLFRR